MFLKSILKTLLIFIFCLQIVSCTNQDTEKESAAKTDNPAESESINDVSNILDRFSNKISSASTIIVKYETGFDVVQDIGQHIEFGNSSKFLIKRPNKGHLEFTSRTGEEKQFNFDGNLISFSTKNLKVYAQVEKLGSLDEAIDHLTETLQTPIPLAELFSSDLPETLNTQLKSSSLIGNTTIDGVLTNHIALRGQKVDAQLWLDVKTDLPKKIKITYKRAEKYPQFWAVFHEWQLNEPIDDSEFNVNFEGYQKILFSPVN